MDIENELYEHKSKLDRLQDLLTIKILHDELVSSTESIKKDRSMDNLDRIFNSIEQTFKDVEKIDSKTISLENLSLESLVNNKINSLACMLEEEMRKYCDKNDINYDTLANEYYVSREDIIDNLTSMYNEYFSKAKDKVEDTFGKLTGAIGRGLYYPILMAKRYIVGKNEYNFKLISSHVLDKNLLSKLDTIANSPLWSPNIERDIALVKRLPQQYGSFETNLTVDEMNKIRAEFDSYENQTNITNFFGIHIKPCKDRGGFVWDIEANADVGKSANVLIDFINNVEPEKAVGIELKFLHHGNEIMKFNSSTFNKMLKEKIKAGVENDNHSNNNDEYKIVLVNFLGSLVKHKLRIYRFIKDLKVQSIMEKEKDENNTQIHDSNKEGMKENES